MSQTQHYLFNLVTQGQIKTDFSRTRVIMQTAKLLSISKQQAETLFNGQEHIIQKELAHSTAYEWRNKLEDIGVITRLDRFAQKHKPTEFSLVPEDEEQTTYDELNEKLEQGDQIVCQHCSHQQPLAPHCNQCGKQLIGKIISC